MNILERRELIEQAINLVEQAQSMVDEVMYDHSNKSHYEAYGKYGFNQLLGNGNPYDTGLTNILNDLDDEDNIDDEDGDNIEDKDGDNIEDEDDLEETVQNVVFEETKFVNEHLEEYYPK